MCREAIFGKNSNGNVIDIIPFEFRSKEFYLKALEHNSEILNKIPQ